MIRLYWWPEGIFPIQKYNILERTRCSEHKQNKSAIVSCVCVLSAVQGVAVFSGWSIAVNLQCLWVVAGCQVRDLEPQQPVPGHWQLWWKSMDKLISEDSKKQMSTVFSPNRHWFWSDVIWGILSDFMQLSLEPQKYLETTFVTYAVFCR